MENVISERDLRARMCEKNKVRDKGRKRGGEKDREGREIHTEIVYPPVCFRVCVRAHVRVCTHRSFLCTQRKLISTDVNFLRP